MRPPQRLLSVVSPAQARIRIRFESPLSRSGETKIAEYSGLLNTGTARIARNHRAFTTSKTLPRWERIARRLRTAGRRALTSTLKG